MNRLVFLEKRKGVPYYFDVEKKELYHRESDTDISFLYVISFVILYLALKYAGDYFESIVNSSVFGGLLTVLVVLLCLSTKTIGKKNLVRCNFCYSELIERLPGIKRHFYMQCIFFATAIAAFIWGITAYISRRSYNGLLLFNSGIIVAHALLVDRFYDKPKVFQMIEQGAL